MRLSRRAALAGLGAGGLKALLPSVVGAADVGVRRFWLAAKPAAVRLTGDARPDTAVWSYNGSVPGPELRVRQGERVRIVVENRLDMDTTVHWHGVRVPHAMDGVPGLTQPPIRPGESFVYEFTPPDAGTFWYHPHANTLQQLGRGLAGVMIVEERELVAVDRDLLWFISDWRLDNDAKIAPGFGNRMEAGMSGRIGNTVTVNGRVRETVTVRAGERVRLRIVNAALARIVALRFEGHRPVIVGYDGQPCDPHSPESDRLVLGPGMRADLILDMGGAPGRRYPVTDDFYRDLAYKLVDIAYEPGEQVREHPAVPPPRLPANPLPEPDLAAAARHQIVLEGGMMGTMGMMRMMEAGGAAWALNNTSMASHAASHTPPLLTLRSGQSCLLSLRNDTAWWHPMHLHGHSFRIVSRDGKANPLREWRDTVLVPPRETADIAFVADNPGDWMFHCHVIDHQETGMMAMLRIA